MREIHLAGNTRDITEVAIRAAREAGAIALEGFRRRDLTIELKSDVSDVVTRYDGMCEDRIRTLILQAYPDSTIIGEESGAHSGAGPLSWFVDPIDGTANYARGIALWAVSIGVAYEGEMVAGVIYDPANDQLFWADDRGAFFAERLRDGGVAASPGAENADSDADADADGGNDGTSAVSMDPETYSVPMSSWGYTSPEQATVGLNFPLPRDLAHDPALALDQFARVTGSFAQLRGVHSTCIALAWIAAGWLDATISFETNPWDVAAGSFIIRKAGGIYCGYRDGAIMEKDRDYLAPHYYAAVPGGEFELLHEIMRTQSLRPSN